MKLLLHIKKIILPAFLLIAGFSVSQNSLVDSLSNSFSKLSPQASRNLLTTIDTTQLEPYDKALWYFYSGLNYQKKDQHHLGINDLLKAEEKFSKLDKWENIANTNYEIHVLLGHQKNGKINAKPYLDKCLKYAKLSEKPLILARAYSRFASDFMHKYNFEVSRKYFDSTLIQLSTIRDTTQREIKTALIELNIATLHTNVAKNIDSALFYYKKTLTTFKKYKINGYIASNYNNLATLFNKKKEYAKAIEYYKKADSVPLVENIPKTKVIFYKNMAEAYDSLKEYKSASYYYSKKIQLTDSINDFAQNVSMYEVDQKYKAAEKDKKIAEKEAKNAQTNTFLTISLSLLALVIISAYLIQKNTRKKQLLAEQKKDLAEKAKDLETQKVINLFKEQELAGIDAMIEGQEKERKRIAEDLHDDLGALMATINLHLENVSTEHTSKALDKTRILLGEAYDKIRNISHVKNAGVIANQGLLVAVENMASKIKSANKIDMEVIAHGLDNRLENSLELSLFRMVQELITNMIKHAEATKASIQLTQHQNNLNIIVYDNGKGFDIDTIKNAGIGLQNIKKRIQHLDGKLTIDSTLNKGTTIVVDIPLTL